METIEITTEILRDVVEALDAWTRAFLLSWSCDPSRPALVSFSGIDGEQLLEENCVPGVG